MIALLYTAAGLCLAGALIGLAGLAADHFRRTDNYRPRHLAVR